MVPAQVLSASTKPRLAGRQPSLRRGAPGDDQAVRTPRPASSGLPSPGDERGAAPVGQPGTRAAVTDLVSADLVARRAVDLLRTDSALCR